MGTVAGTGLRRLEFRQESVGKPRAARRGRALADLIEQTLALQEVVERLLQQGAVFLADAGLA